MNQKAIANGRLLKSQTHRFPQFESLVAPFFTSAAISVFFTQVDIQVLN